MNKKKLEIVFVSPEAVPFAKTGGLADVIASLPKTLASLECEVKVFLPLYREVMQKKFPLRLLKKNLIIRVGKRYINFSLYHLKKGRVNFCFIKKDIFFDRQHLYSKHGKDYPDNALRFSFFSQAVLASLMNLNIKPDIIHCNEWQSALIPFHLKFSKLYQDYFKDTKTVFTIHNLIYQGLFPKSVLSKIGIDRTFFVLEHLEFYGNISLIKAGLLYGDALTTVSKGYARQILTRKFGCGLENLLRKRKDDLSGILNGIDYSLWNPEKDKLIKFNYSSRAINNKQKCKKDLLQVIGLENDLARPLFGNVSRLVPDKGIDIIINSIPEMIDLNCRVVFLGVGDEDINRKLSALAKKYPKNIAVKIGFDNGLAHKIEAGCDMFLMPSRNEPCGLNQLYSLKYGTIPIVGAVGGLDDTIIDYRSDPKKGNGFKLKPVNKKEFLLAVIRAIDIFNDKKTWNKLIRRAMKSNFSWERSAKEYIKLYKRIKDKG